MRAEIFLDKCRTLELLSQVTIEHLVRLVDVLADAVLATRTTQWLNVLGSNELKELLLNDVR